MANSRYIIIYSVSGKGGVHLDELFDVLIIGSGPAGVSAALTAPPPARSWSRPLPGPQRRPASNSRAAAPWLLLTWAAYSA